MNVEKIEISTFPATIQKYTTERAKQQATSQGGQKKDFK
jgi:hypothetical protein